MFEIKNMHNEYETFHVNWTSGSHPTNSDIPHSWSKYYVRAKK